MVFHHRANQSDRRRSANSERLRLLARLLRFVENGATRFADGLGLRSTTRERESVMSTRRPDFFEEVKVEKARLLPVYCAECRRISEEIPVRIARRRMFEDLAAAFAYLGVLCAWTAPNGDRLPQNSDGCL